MVLLRKNDPKQEKKPRHIEIWGHLVEVNRALSRMLIVSAGIALISVSGLVWAVTAALQKPIVYYVDSDGHASHGGRLEGASRPLEVEVAFIAKEYLRRTTAYNSLTVERDFADGFNLMTSEMQAREEKRLEAWKESKGTPFVEYVRRAGIRTILEFEGIEIENHGNTRFSVRVLGTLKTWPLASDAEAAPRAKAFESQLGLVVVGRTEEIPNGLLVSHQSIQYFEAEDAAEDLKDTKGLSNGDNE